MMSPAAVPVRRSSILHSTSKSRIQDVSHPSLPPSASDLADNIASLTLADDLESAPSKTLGVTGVGLEAVSDLSCDDMHARTPQPRSGAFPSFVLSPTAQSRPATTSTALSSELSFGQTDLFEIDEEIGDAHDAIQIIQGHIFSIQE